MTHGTDTPDSATAFHPAWWLPGAHLQTLWGPLWRKPPPLERRRERLWLADGDFLDLDWLAPDDPEAPLVLLLHGLTSSSRSPYVFGLQQALAQRGRASVALNWRGCSGEPNRLPRAYHSGSSDDLAAVIAHLGAIRPRATLHAVGYSLGGNILLKYLGESGAACSLQAAVAVSVPFRLDQCADRIALGFSRLYQAHFMRELRAYVQDKRRLFAARGQAEHLATLDRLGPVQGLRNFWEFDGYITAPLHGFLDAHDYYRRASCYYVLGAIRVPTLIIQAIDDPFVYPHSLPRHDELAPQCSLELHSRGGHLGFVAGALGRPEYYLERRIPDWLDTQAP